MNNIVKLLNTIEQVSDNGNCLCNRILGRYLPSSGNVGIFCQTEVEFRILTRVREQLTEPSNNPNQKYFTVYEPIIISSKGDIPKTVYTHLYIRKPDPTPYGRFTGDVDFILEPIEYSKLKQAVINNAINGAEIYNRPGWDTVQLSDVNINSVAFVSTKDFADKVRIKF